MLATDRCHYAKCNPYMDSPQSIGKNIYVKVVCTSFGITQQFSCMC